MLNFFKKLRKQEMRGARYLKYAFGEILLVVIGILIALGINNWNEERKNRKKEKAFLADIHREFLTNQEQLAYIKSRHEECLAYSNKLLALFPIDVQKVNLDSLAKYRRLAGGDWTFEPVQGRINWLVNNEAFDLIKNTELQEALLAWQPTYNDYHEDEQAALDFNFQQLYPYRIEKMPPTNGFKDPRFDLKELESMRFENMMRTRNGRLRAILHNYTQELQRLEALIDKILQLTAP